MCIGSCLAPILSDLVLAQLDRKLQEALKESAVQKVFRFVDDFLIIFRAAVGSSAQKVRELYKIFCDVLGEFDLTKEEPTNGELQFLDVRLHLDRQHVCWTYAPRSKKALLPHSSAHSKLVKRAVATSALKNSLSRSCEHTVEISFHTQIQRLRSAGYPEQLLHSVANRIMGDLRNTATKKVPQDEHKKRAVIPYVHGVSHNLKKIVGRSGVDLLFSAPNKLGGLCKRVNQEEARKHCTKSHATPFVQCEEGVVYEIPLSCKKSYIGQTGRCLNDRLREHANSLKTGTGSMLVQHVKTCNSCVPDFEACRVLKRYRGQRTREICEAFLIHSRGSSCVSTPSVALLDKELAYLAG